MSDNVHVTIDNIQQLNSLISYGPPQANKKWSIVIMVDSGYGRDGVDPEDDESIELARVVVSR